MTIDLSYLDKPIADAAEPPSATGGPPLPDGVYQAWIDMAEIVDNPKLQFPALSLIFVEMGQLRREAKVFQLFDPSPERVPYLKKLLRVLWDGVNVPTPSALPARVGEVLDRCYEIVVKTNARGYQNTYVNRFLSGVQKPSSVLAGDSEIPF